MAVKGVSFLSVKSLFISLLLFAFCISPTFAQKKVGKKKSGIFPKRKKERLTKGELLAYQQNLAEDIEIPNNILLEPENQFILENGFHCEDAQLKEIIEDLLLTTNDSFLFNTFDFTNAVDTYDGETGDTTESICEDETYIFLNDSQTVIPIEYLNYDEYYAIWDSQNLDSYGFDLKDFKDTIVLKLYEENNWSPPVKATEINSMYGLRRWRWHHGVDLDLNRGDSIYAAFDGIVRMAKYNWGGYGYYVMLRHKNGLETLYGHLTKYLVKVGQEVKAGELIGLGGSTGRSTGPHLHFETRYKGHAFDPNFMYDFTKDSLRSSSFELTAKHYKGLVERSKNVYHKLRSGDTLSHLALRYGTSINRICRINGISRNTILRVGKTLRIR